MKVALGFVALALAIAATHVDLLGFDRYPIFRDFLGFVLPAKRFLADTLRSGELPFWNPYVYLGTPFLGGLQSAVFYPPTLLLLMPFPAGVVLFLLFHFLIAAIGALFWLRDRRLGPLPSTIGAAVFTLGGYLISVLGMTNHLQSAAWTPLVLLAWTRLARRNQALPSASFVLLLVLQTLGGSPEHVLFTIALCGVASLEAADCGPRALLLDGARLASAGTVALLVLAAQVLPTLEYLGQSTRSGPLELREVVSWSLSPTSLVQLLLPHSSSIGDTSGGTQLGLGLEDPIAYLHTIYLGVVPLCLIAAGAVGSGRAIWIATAVGAFLIGEGDRLPFLPWLYELAPAIVGRFRYPEKFWFLAHVSATVLAAEGTARILDRDRPALAVSIVVAGASLVAGTVLGWLGRFDPSTLTEAISGWVGAPSSAPLVLAVAADFTIKGRRLALLATLFVVLAAGLRAGRLSAPLVGLALVTATLVDLATAHRNFNLSLDAAAFDDARMLVDPRPLREKRLRVFTYQRVTKVDPSLLEPDSELGLRMWLNPFDATADLRRFWLATARTAYLNLGMLRGVGTPVGFDGVVRRSTDVLEAMLAVHGVEGAVRILRGLSVAALEGTAAIEAPELVAESPAPPSLLHVYRMREPVPHVRLVGRLRLATSLREATAVLASPDFRPESEALVEFLPPGWFDREDATRRTEARYPGPNRIEVTTEAATPSFLVVGESWFPGWTANIDGEPASIQPTNVLVSGLPVAAGRHEVLLRYEPTRFREGLALSLLGLGLVVALAIRSRQTG